MSLDKSNLVVALHALAPHNPMLPVAVIGSNNRVIDHARYDDAANGLVCRLPYEVWEKEGRGIVQAGTNPTNQWFPMIEEKDEAQANPTKSATESGYAYEPENARVSDKLPEEYTPGHLTLPENVDTTHIPEEPPTPKEQHEALTDQRIQMVQTVVGGPEDDPTVNRVLPTNAPEKAGFHQPDEVTAPLSEDPKLNEQPTPKEQHENLNEPRIAAVQDIVTDSENTEAFEPGSEDKLAHEQVQETKDERATDRHPEVGQVQDDGTVPAEPKEDDSKDDVDPNEKGGESDGDLEAIAGQPGGYRKLRSIAHAENIPNEEINDAKTAKDLVALIELKRGEVPKAE